MSGSEKVTDISLTKQQRQNLDKSIFYIINQDKFYLYIICLQCDLNLLFKYVIDISVHGLSICLFGTSQLFQ